MSGMNTVVYFVVNHGLIAFVLCACYFETLRWLWVTVCLINILFLIRGLEDKLVFYSEEPADARTWIDLPSIYGIQPAGYDEFYLITEDGVRLHCYFLKYRNGQAKPEWTILMLHGNAGNIGHRLINAAQLSEACCANVLLLEYRGYGMSDGRPSERGFYRDAETAVAFLANTHPVGIVHLRRYKPVTEPTTGQMDSVLPETQSNTHTTAVPIEGNTEDAAESAGWRRRTETISTSAYLAELQIDVQRIAVLGQSIGGAVAIYLASSDCPLRTHVAALLLENTFTSLPDIGKLLFRSAVPLVTRIPNWLVKNQFNSLCRIATVRCSTLFISGSSDQLVPPRMMYALHERARDARIRRLVKFPRGTHNDTWMSHGYYPALSVFLTDATRYTTAT